MSLSPETHYAYHENRLAIERKQPKAALLVPAYSWGFTAASIAHQKAAEKWAEGFRRRRALETELIRDTGRARQSTASLAREFGVNVLTARRARIALENRGMIPRVMIRRCQDGRTVNTANIGGSQHVQDEGSEREVSVT